MSATSFTKSAVTFAVCAMAILIAVFRTSAKAVRADAAPQWPMFGGSPQRNMANPLAKNLPVAWDIDAAKPKNIKWMVNLGSKSSGAPVVAGGRVFIGTNNQKPRDLKWIQPFIGNNAPLIPIDLGVLMCFRESDGAFLWQAVHEKLPGAPINDAPLEGIGSAPVVEGDRLYYVSNRCELICADVKTGEAIWTLDMIKELGVFPHQKSVCSPLIVGDVIMVVTSNGVNAARNAIPAPKAPSFLAVDKKNGWTVWMDNSPTAKLVNAKAANFNALANLGEVVMHQQWSNPAFGIVNGKPQVVFPGGDGWLYSFDPHGTLIWKFDANPKDAVIKAKQGTRNAFIGTPVIYKNRVYIGVGQDPENGVGVGHLWCIDMTKVGDVSAELRLANNKMGRNANSAVVWHYGGPIDSAADQRKLRRNNYFGRTVSTCAIHDDLVYAADWRGDFHCLDANTGEPQWEFDTKADIRGSPLYADGKVYLGTDDSTVWVFAHGRQKKVLAENEMDARIRATPVANNSVLFIATENKLYAIHKN